MDDRIQIEVLDETPLGVPVKWIERNPMCKVSHYNLFMLVPTIMPDRATELIPAPFSFCLN